MADKMHVQMLAQGARVWNQWRQENPNLRPDLQELRMFGRYGLRAQDHSHGLDVIRICGKDIDESSVSALNLRGIDLDGADLSGSWIESVSMSNISLREATINEAQIARSLLDHVDLRGAIVGATKFWEVRLSSSDWREAFINHVAFFECIMEGCDLTSADLRYSTFTDTTFPGTRLNGCSVYGSAAWNVDLTSAEQYDLVITDTGEHTVTVDNLELAQFIHLLLNNKKLRDVIDTITSKVVLILGRFTDERKPVLNAIREELHKRDYAPVVFDFTKPASRDMVETVSTLAHMARFVIADITDAKSVLQELQAITPHLPSVPVQPILLQSQHEPGMWDHFARRESVLKPYIYADQDSLLASLSANVIGPAEALAKKLTGR